MSKSNWTKIPLHFRSLLNSMVASTGLIDRRLECQAEEGGLERSNGAPSSVGSSLVCWVGLFRRRILFVFVADSMAAHLIATFRQEIPTEKSANPYSNIRFCRS
jgi:hypothetical protein